MDMTFYPLSNESLFKLGTFLFWAGLYIISTLNYPSKSAEWHSRVVTLLHGGITSIAGIAQCQPWSLTISRLSEPCTDPQYALMLWSWGYFAFDLLWCLTYWSESGLMLFHHACALASITAYLHKLHTGCTFACSIALLEVSNPLLQARWFLRDEGYAHTFMFRIVEISYLVVFFTMRAILGTYIIYNVVTDDFFDKEEKIICIALYGVSVAFFIEIFGFISYKYKAFVDKCRELLDRYGILLNE